MKRPDLSNVDSEIIAYIEFLEKKAGVRNNLIDSIPDAQDNPTFRVNDNLPVEQETKVNIITISREGLAKRTPRHLYTRQHRGGMGMFGVDIALPDYPTVLSSSEETQTLIFFTNHARVFRQSAQIIAPAGVFGSAKAINERFSFDQGEMIVAVLPEQAKGYVALVSENGRLRCLRHHLFGEHMRQGTSLYNYVEFGSLVSACWTPGDADLFLITQQGIGIRFAEKAISPQGDQAIRVSEGDRVVSVTSVNPDSSVFMIGADGRGTVRLMSGFAPNKSPGGSGKAAIKNNNVVSAVRVDAQDDLFVISRLGKIIRFPVSEVPSTEGVVQGVNIMSFRGDEVVAVLPNGPIY